MPHLVFSTLALLIAHPAGAAMLDMGPMPGAPGRDVAAQGISANGNAVVGQAGNGWDNQLFRWTASTGYQAVGPVFSRPFSYAQAVGKSGYVVVGSAPLTPGSSDLRAFWWTANSGFIDLGTLGGPSSGAYAISDGDSYGRDFAIAGFADNAQGTQRAFRWTQASGMLDLGSLPGSPRSFAYGISGDGNVVVGSSGTLNNDSKAFRWDVASSTMIDLGSLGMSSAAYATNHDGSVVVGYSYRYLSDLSVRETAFRWTAASGMQPIGRLSDTDTTRSMSRAVNGDGSVVVGKRGDSAFRWTTTNGLIDLGVLPGDRYSDATGVSADGRVVVGKSMDANFVSRAFIWTPGPSPMQDLSSLQSSLVRSAERVSRLVRGQPQRPYELTQVAAQPDRFGAPEMTLRCASRLTTDCSADQPSLALLLASR